MVLCPPCAMSPRSAWPSWNRSFAPTSQEQAAHPPGLSARGSGGRGQSGALGGPATEAAVVAHAPYFIDASELGDLLPLTGTVTPPAPNPSRDGRAHASLEAPACQYAGHGLDLVLDYPARGRQCHRAAPFELRLLAFLPAPPEPRLGWTFALLGRPPIHHPVKLGGADLRPASA